MWILVTSPGLEWIERDIRASAGRARFLTPALEEVGQDMMRTTKIQFESGGRRGGGSWSFPSADWEARKLKEGGDPRPLIQTGRLMKSVTREGSSEMILDIKGNKLTFGSRVPYADVHQHGDPARNIPARPFLVFLESDQNRWRKIITGWIVDPMKRRRGTFRA